MSNVEKNTYDYKHKKDGSCDPMYITEFEQGNFRHAAMQTRYTGQELLKIFLCSDKIAEEEKIKQLLYMARKITYIASNIDQAYDNHIIQNNNNVRNIIKASYENYLKKGQRISFNEFNDTKRWKNEGGRSRPKGSVEEEEHEWHEYYLQKRKEHIQECMKYFLDTNLWDPLEIVREYTKYFIQKEYIEVVESMDIPADKKTKILKDIQQAYLLLPKE